MTIKEKFETAVKNLQDGNISIIKVNNIMGEHVIPYNITVARDEYGDKFFKITSDVVNEKEYYHVCNVMNYFNFITPTLEHIDYQKVTVEVA